MSKQQERTFIKNSMSNSEMELLIQRSKHPSGIAVKTVLPDGSSVITRPTQAWNGDEMGIKYGIYCGAQIYH